jgi:predicted HTH transcriptional regulator
VTIDGLTATSGSADYIAMREALVNLFIHQDYGDPRTVGQIEISPDRTRFFNAGHALVSKEALAEGGTSQARNPLISRALKLIKFAELAGSGLRQVYRAWGEAQRHPPEIVSDSGSNTFSLTLNWRLMPVVIDTFWKKRIGLSMDSNHALIVLMAAEPDGVTIETIAASQQVPISVARKRAQYLATNGLVVMQDGGRVMLREDRRTLVEQAKQQSSANKTQE